MSFAKFERPLSVRTIQSKSNLRNSIMTFFDDTMSSVIGGPDK
jgi:hypothetical protein